MAGAAEAILTCARELDVELIVMGKHHLGFVEHMLAGSVAEKVVRHAPCPVLIVQHPEGARTRATSWWPSRGRRLTLAQLVDGDCFRSPTQQHQSGDADDNVNAHQRDGSSDFKPVEGRHQIDRKPYE